MPLPPRLLDDLKPWTRVRFERSSGPGGQNVNKVSSRVILRFDFEACPLLTDDQKNRVRRGLSRRLTRDGQLQVSVQQDRSQSANRRAAELLLLSLLERAWKRQRVRRATAPTAGARVARLAEKRRRGQVKQSRRGTAAAED